MKKGFSYETFAALLSVSRETLYEWERVHPEFSDTKSQAMELSQYFWESEGLKGMNNPREFNGTLWMFNMKARFGWRDGIESNTFIQTTVHSTQIQAELNKLPIADIIKALMQGDSHAISKSETKRLDVLE